MRALIGIDQLNLCPRKINRRGQNRKIGDARGNSGIPKGCLTH